MSAETDFALTIDRAAGLALEAACSARAAGYKPLPQPHRRLLSTATNALDRAQQALFEARNTPWDQPQPMQRQLELR